MLRHLPPTASPDPFDSTCGWAGITHPREAIESFRREMAEYLGVPACQLASSGRTALFLLLRALAQEPSLADRREVVLPAYTCPAVAKVALDVGSAAAGGHLARHVRFRSRPPVCGDWQADACGGARSPLWPAPAHRAGFGPRPPGRSCGDRGRGPIHGVAGRPVGAHGDFGLYSLDRKAPVIRRWRRAQCQRESVRPRVSDTWRTLPTLEFQDRFRLRYVWP